MDGWMDGLMDVSLKVQMDNWEFRFGDDDGEAWLIMSELMRPFKTFHGCLYWLQRKTTTKTTTIITITTTIITITTTITTTIKTTLKTTITQQE